MRHRISLAALVLLCWSWSVGLVASIGTAEGFTSGEADFGPSAISPPGMSFVQALVLGVVEGLTEYLPVSSTGHLLLAQRAMGIGGGSESPSGQARSRKEASDAYAICIQGGAIMAVLLLYWGRVKVMVMGLLGKDPQGLQLAFRVLVAFLPAAFLGLLLEAKIKEHLFGPWPVVAAWFAGGAVILWFGGRAPGPVRPTGNSLETLSWAGALLIGVIQCAAMWPGVSRSLATIIGGILAGLCLPAAVEFSFLLGVVTLGAATLLDAVKYGRVMAQFLEPAFMVTGFLAAFFSALAAVRWMVGYLQRHGLEVFGYYRIGLALAVSMLLLTGIL